MWYISTSRYHNRCWLECESSWWRCGQWKTSWYGWSKSLEYGSLMLTKTSADTVSRYKYALLMWWTSRSTCFTYVVFDTLSHFLCDKYQRSYHQTDRNAVQMSRINCQVSIICGWGNGLVRGDCCYMLLHELTRKSIHGWTFSFWLGSAWFWNIVAIIL